MLNSKNVPTIDGMRIDEAHKGGGSLLKKVTDVAMSPIKKLAIDPIKKGMAYGQEMLMGPMPGAGGAGGDSAQDAELDSLKKKEAARVAAMGRKKQGRASLLSGNETGQFKNLLG